MAFSYRVRGLYPAVETDYIIKIEATSGSFGTYRISKQFSEFRSLRRVLKAIAKKLFRQQASWSSPLGQYCWFVAQSIASEPTSYLGKTSYLSVKSQAKQRRRILDMVLMATCKAPFHPADSYDSEIVEPILNALATFLLTDVVVPEDDDQSSSSDSRSGRLTVDTSSPANNNNDAVVPISMRRRLSSMERQHQDQQLKEACSRQQLTIESSSAFSSTTTTTTNLQQPAIFVPCFVVAVAVLYKARRYTVELNVDILLFLVLGALLVGRCCSSGNGSSRKPVAPSATDVSVDYQFDTTMVDPNPSELLRKTLSVRSALSMPSTAQHYQPCSPLPEFPAGAELGSHSNCWSRPAPEEFHVRGPHYDQNHKKVPSQQFLCPVSGLDLFLTDACPETVHQNSLLLGGKLHDKPRIVISFRLPWGVMLLYGDIPDRFVPYLHDKERPIDEFADPAERALAKWFQADAKYRNERLKIIPSVVDGPWVVRGVVSGRPTLIGAKLPVEYHFGHEIVEISLDICASAAARGILSVTR
jgi:Protein ENHANCED DISEASE RESISTANCE 2, C-terminal